MNQIKKAFMLIPDISGFTHFVNHTEIIHGVHIISEILETLIESNTMGLKVAEVEGDAIFFYKLGGKPIANELYKQIEAMYFSFHKMIKKLERDRVCSCGACSTVNNLKIKFVSHYGVVVERNIHSHFQLMGSDVIKIHKLLKNNVNNNEYFLITENSLKEIENEANPFWSQMQSKSINYDGIGDVLFQFSFLEAMKKEVPALQPARKFETSDKVIHSSISINGSMEKTYNMLTDMEIKKNWVKGIKKITYDTKQIQRNGSKHTCVLPLTTIHVETVDSSLSKNEMVFTEFTAESSFLPAFYSRFTVKKVDDNNCILSNETHYRGNRIKEFFLGLFFDKAIKKKHR